MKNKKTYYEISDKRKLFLRLLAMLIDSSLIIVFIIVFTFVFDHKLLYSMMFSALVAVAINIFSIFLFPKNYSLGNLISRLSVSTLNGSKNTTPKLIFRQVMLTVYWIPFLNGMVLLTNIVSIMIYKNMYTHDFFTKTKVQYINSPYLHEEEDDE